MNFILDTCILLDLNKNIIKPRIGVNYYILYTINNEINQDRIKNTLKHKMIKNFIKMNGVLCIGILNEECGDDSIVKELKKIDRKKYYFVTNDIGLKKKVLELGFKVLNQQELIITIKSKKISEQQFFIFLRSITNHFY